jgi:hypothetical protein
LKLAIFPTKAEVEKSWVADRVDLSKILIRLAKCPDAVWWISILIMMHNPISSLDFYHRFIYLPSTITRLRQLNLDDGNPITWQVGDATIQQRTISLFFDFRRTTQSKDTSSEIDLRGIRHQSNLFSTGTALQESESYFDMAGTKTRVPYGPLFF